MVVDDLDPARGAAARRALAQAVGRCGGDDDERRVGDEGAGCAGRSGPSPWRATAASAPACRRCAARHVSRSCRQTAPSTDIFAWAEPELLAQGRVVSGDATPIDDPHDLARRADGAARLLLRRARNAARVRALTGRQTPYLVGDRRARRRAAPARPRRGPSRPGGHGRRAGFRPRRPGGPPSARRRAATTAAPGVGHPARVAGLVVGRRVRVRDQDRRAGRGRRARTPSRRRGRPRGRPPRARCRTARRRARGCNSPPAPDRAATARRARRRRAGPGTTRRRTPRSPPR